MYRVTFYCDDDIKLSSGTEEFEIVDLPDKRPFKLKGLCRQYALLKGHYKSCAIDNIKVKEVHPSWDLAYAKKKIEDFVDYLVEYAKTCQDNGYDGIGTEDIKDKFKEYYE